VNHLILQHIFHNDFFYTAQPHESAAAFCSCIEKKHSFSLRLSLPMNTVETIAVETIT